MSSTGSDSATRSPGPVFDTYDYSAPNATPRGQSPTGDNCTARVDAWSLSRYKHKVLPPDCVRLLKLYANPDNKPSSYIKASLVVVPIDKLATINFEALSYAWGEDKPRKGLDLRDEPAETALVTSSITTELHDLKSMWMLFKQFYVRENLFKALRRLQSTTCDVFVWVDALCINQEDDAEKTQQLSKMPLVYRSAWSVIIWIGEEFGKWDMEKRAIDFIPRVLNLTLLDTLLEPETATSHRISAADMADIVAGWVSFAYLLERPWFHRRWVIQEVAYAQRVAIRCGKHVLSWLDFADAVEILMRRVDSVVRLCKGQINNLAWTRIGIKHQLIRETMDHIQNGRALALVQATHTVFRKTRKGDVLDRLWSLESLVTEFTSFDTTDPRDMIYAYLSLANDGPLAAPHGIEQPSYYRTASTASSAEESGTILLPQYSTKTVDMYIAFIKYCVATTRSLDIICRHWASQLPDIPSWVGLVEDSAFGAPSTSQGRINADSLVGKSKQRVYNASRGRPAEVHFELPNPEALKVKPPPASAPKDAAPAGESHAATSSRKRKHEAIVSGTGSEAHEEHVGRTVNNIKRHKTVVNYREHKLEKNWLQNMIGSKCCLFARGFVLGRVTKVTPRVVNGILASEHLTMLGWNRDMPFETFPDQLWRTLVADRDPTGCNAPMWYKRACAYAMMRVSHEGNLETTRIIAEADEQPEAIVEYCRRVQSVIWNWTVFMYSDENADLDPDHANSSEQCAPLESPSSATSPLSDMGSSGTADRSPSPALRRHIVGLGSRNVLPDDVVCILFGCSVPVVLRKGKWFYRLIGEAYINGKMDGEAFAGMDANVLQERTVEFAIR